MRFHIPFLLALPLACACARSGPNLPDIALPSLAASETRVNACPTAKCLTVFVAPWCGYCRAATPAILGLRDFLKGHGVTTRIIVGLDRPESVRAYARDFGPDTLVDTRQAWVLGGVPHFFVSDASGRIVKEVAGVPMGVRDVEEFAGYFGLP